MENVQKQIDELQGVLASLAIKIFTLNSEIKFEKLRQETDACVFKEYGEKFTNVKIVEPHVKTDEHFMRQQIENARQEFVTDMLAASAKFKEKTGLKIVVSYKVNDFITL